MTPRVSIITPLHNKGRYVGHTIESVLGQTVADLEMLGVENHSTDDAPKVVKELASRDSRVRLIYAPPEVRGPGAARNLGLAEAKGEWVLFLDADDLLEPDYLEHRLSILKSYPKAKIIAGPWKNFYPDAPDVFETHFPNGWKPPYGTPPDSIYAYSPWALHAAIVHRDVLGSPKPWLEELDGLPAEDNAFWFRVLHGKTIFWNEADRALYRKETGNSRDESGMDFSKGFSACLANLRANTDFLKLKDLRPTDPMAATAVRVLRKWRRVALAHKVCGVSQIEEEIRHHLGLTSPKNVRMLFWKIYFAMSRILPKN
jgi:glycosyltransferase involved in cell wall biosynthesis